MRHILRAAILLTALGITSPAYGDTAITANSPVQGRLERGDRTRGGDWDRQYVDPYTYAGEAGEELYIFTDHPHVSLGIEGPARFSQRGSSGHGLSVRLPQRGRYTITASLGVGTTGPNDYELRVSRVITDQSSTILSLGQETRGGLTTLDSAGLSAGARQDTYTYSSSAGEAAVFRFDGEAANLVLEIQLADGVRLFADSSRGEAGRTVYFDTAGEHRVLIRGAGGNYSIMVQPRQPAATAPPTNHILVGDTVHLSYSADAAVNASHSPTSVYTFDARRGDRLAVVRSRAAGILIRDPDGLSVHYSYDSDEETLAARAQFTAPSSGVYRIEAQTWPEMTPAESTLSLVGTAQGASMMAEARARGERQRAERDARIAQALQRGEQSLNSGNYQDAISAFNEVLAIDYQNVPAQIGNGVAHYREGYYMAARWAFESALANDPNNQLAAANLAAARQAEEARRRDDRLAFEARQRERSEAVSNAIGAFVSTYSAVETARLQAEAEAAARAQAAQQAAVSAPQQTASPTLSTGSGSSTARGPGANGCAEKSGNRIFNRCNYSISVAIAAVINNRTESEIYHIGPSGTQTTVQQARILASCNYDPSSSNGARGAVLTPNGGAECR